jgi:hypothetical protein
MDGPHMNSLVTVCSSLAHPHDKLILRMEQDRRLDIVKEKMVQDNMMESAYVGSDLDDDD